MKKILSFTLLFSCTIFSLYGYKHSYFNDTGERLSFTAIYNGDTGANIKGTGLDIACRRDYRNLEPGVKTEIDTGSCLIQEIFAINEFDRPVVSDDAQSKGLFLSSQVPKNARPMNVTIENAIASGKKWGRWRSLGNRATPSKTFKFSKDKNGNLKLTW
jgi:hypothetical protein